MDIFLTPNGSMNIYYTKGNFDDKDFRLCHEILIIRKELVDANNKIEAKRQAGTFNEEKLQLFISTKDKVMKTIGQLVDMPMIKFYKKYDYFICKKALLDVSKQ